MENLPLYVSLFFCGTTALSVYIFFRAAGRSRTILLVLLGWLGVQAVVGSMGFYTVTDTMPPRFILSIGPPLLLIAGLFSTAKGRRFIDSLDLKTLTFLHIVRVPVEIVLLWLFLHKGIPQLMTFEGRNFDILSGLTAPVVYYFSFKKRKLGRTGLLVWNFLCLALLINIVVMAILTAPFVFQRLAFDQPNIAVLYFPFIWLPACVVPLVLFSHLAAIRQLFGRKSSYKPVSFPAAKKSFV